ncbi:flavin-containing monooxygenase [Nocardia altamirensis]|uniref:flavin-containing monooxygenase n=1 Tax=Nocardia altamirensis TaxID=472158 RepID=UPI000A06B463|nr:NAD(P)/FAD-dependent oxidoreductase [Nocardia altamirensis]
MSNSVVRPDYQVAIIGAGPGGIAAGVKLTQAGITDFVILERADDFGGSWHENHYPGIAVDVPALAYQFSFARNPNWSRFFPFGAEVKRYHVGVARRFDLYPHARFNTDIVREEWDEAGHFWKLHTADRGVVTARFVISAVGAFVRPKQDAGIPGYKSFKGKVQRPTDWDHDYDLIGKTVAVIGTGASAVQIVPAIAGKVAALKVFQRTPVWCIPKPDFAVPALLQKVFAVPGVVALTHGAVLMVVDLLLRGAIAAPVTAAKPAMRTFDRAAIAAYSRYLRWAVEDPATARKLAPNYGPVAKRPTMSRYTTTFNRDNVELITEPIEKITAKGIKTRDGVTHSIDVLVLATGYEVFSDPETYREGSVLGRDGFDLGKFYNEEGLQAYQSVSVPKLPNRWTLVGPYSWTGSGWHAFVEMTADHAVRAIRTAEDRKATFVEIRREPAEAYHAKVYRKAEALRFYLADLNGHVPTYYRNSQGDTTYIRPSGFFEARRGNQRFPLDDYRYDTLGAATSTGSAPANESSEVPA